MNSERLLKHFERISEAPEAVARLRRFILDLAVRGKLVAQDPNDEPAEELLRRIQAEKVRLMKNGLTKKEKHLPPIEEDEALFVLPVSWVWARLQDITSYIQRGKSPIYAVDDGLPVVSQKCVQWSGLDLSVARQITIESIKKYEEIRFLREDDLLWNSTGTGTIGRVVRVVSPPEKLVCDSHVTVVRCALANAEYVRSWLCSDHIYQSIEDRAAGSTNQVELTAQMTTFQVVPLPPLAEQHRIVAKVDELMGLCDQLEAARNEREARRDRLVAASLHHLQNTDDLPPSRQDAKKSPAIGKATLGASAPGREPLFLQSLPRLTTRPEHIKQLRQTILNLAVRGRLVPQGKGHTERASNSPATLRQVANGHLFSEALATSTVPSHWKVAPLESVAAEIVDCPHSTPKWTESGKICVRTNQFRPGSLDLLSVRFVSEATYIERIQRLQPIVDDILYSREGGILGVACRVPANVEICLGQRMMLIRSGPEISPIFLEMVLNSPLITEIAHRKTTGGAAPRVNVSTVRAYPIPLPPLAEQHRIVAKVDELMALCDQLETQLTTSQADSRRLLEAVLRDALAPALAEAI